MSDQSSEARGYSHIDNKYCDDAGPAQARACRAFAKMSDHAVDRPDGRLLRLIAYAVCVGAAILVIGLWVLHDGNLADV